MSTQLVVAGFHRSGTSLTAQILHRSGVFLGSQLLPPHRSNPYGHFEDQEIVELHDGILADNGLSWQVDGPPLPTVGEEYLQRMRELVESREEHEAWGFKDPRVCLFLPAWKEVLPDARVLLVYRNFAEATHSLHRRAADGLLRGTKEPRLHRRFWEVPDLALKMWLTHNRALLDFARAHPEDTLAFSTSMLGREFPLVETLNHHWKVGLEETPTADVFDKSITSGRDGRQPVADEGLIGEVLDTWKALERLGRSTGELAGWSAPTGEQATEEDFYKPSDAYALLMENEFLNFKVTYLQESLEKARRSRKQRQTPPEKAKDRPVTPRLKRGPVLTADDELMIVYPRAGDVFYEMLARRLIGPCKEAFSSVTARSAGEVCSMEENLPGDVTVAVVAPARCYFELPDKDGLTRRLSGAGKRVMVLAESAETVWFENQFKVPIHFDALIDLGFVSQREKLDNFEIPYLFLFNAPTQEERQRIEQAPRSGRGIPWATVGHNRTDRTKLAHDLTHRFDPEGFVFLPPPGIAVREDRGMISPGSLDALLRKTRYYVWQSLHEFSYYESFRFREAILAGAAPCKVDPTASRWRESSIPGIFPSVESFVETVREEGFESIHESAKEFYLSQGLLADRLEEALEGV